MRTVLGDAKVISRMPPLMAYTTKDRPAKLPELSGGTTFVSSISRLLSMARKSSRLGSRGSHMPVFGAATKLSMHPSNTKSNAGGMPAKWPLKAGGFETSRLTFLFRLNCSAATMSRPPGSKVSPSNKNSAAGFLTARISGMNSLRFFKKFGIRPAVLPRPFPEARWNKKHQCVGVEFPLGLRRERVPGPSRVPADNNSLIALAPQLP